MVKEAANKPNETAKQTPTALTDAYNATANKCAKLALFNNNSGHRAILIRTRTTRPFVCDLLFGAYSAVFEVPKAPYTNDRFAVLPSAGHFKRIKMTFEIDISLLK